MKTIPISSIQVADNRQRRNFDLKSLQEIGGSIKQHGLFHPITLRKEENKLILVSGERRLRAITDLYEVEACQIKHDGQLIPLGEVPWVDLGELSELEKEEAELSENIHRSDLSWQERAEATARLAKLRGGQATAAGLLAPTVAAIAQEVRGSSEGVHQELTRREILVAKHLADPEVKGAKDVSEAFKILKRKEEAQRRVLLAAEVGKTYSAETAHTAIHEDSIAWMVKQEAGQFDVILTDPPYGISADEFGDSGGKAAGAHFYEDSYESWKILMAAFAGESFRLAKEQAHLYAFCAITRFEELKGLLGKAGWTCFRTPIIWHKPNGNRVPWVTSGPQRKWEIILYAKKGDKAVTKIFPDLVTYPSDTNLGHHAQKPVALYSDLLRRSCNAGDAVLDPFAGSGPVFPAAQELKLKATGVEQDTAAYGLCLARLDKLKSAPELAGL